MPSITEQPRYHPNQFEFKSLAEVPDSHEWATVHDHPFVDASGPDAVPVIDLEGPDAVPLIGAACREWGVFQVVGHGIPADLFDRLESRTQKLFSLPTSQKLKAARGPNKIAGYGVQTITSFFSKFFWSEGYSVIGPPHDDARLLWPEAEDCADFCALVEEYTTALRELGGRVVHLMLLSLGLTEDDIEHAGPLKDFRQATPVLQLNSYPACPDPDKAIGLAAHQDTSLVTILHQTTKGLQVLRAEDQNGPARWVTVPLVPGSLVVNLGDLSHILSNGRFISVVHRAIVNRTHHRASAAYFLGSAGHVQISPIEKAMDPGEKPTFRAVTWPEYLGIKKKLFDNSLESIKLPAGEEVVEEEDGNGNNASGIPDELKENGAAVMKQ